MSAVDHINKTQKLRVFHMSWSTTPPHLQTPITESWQYEALDNNVHPDVLHAGTRRSALTIHRTHLHEYEVDPNVVDPVTYADAKYIMEDIKNAPWRANAKDFHAAMRGKQQSLWETITGNPQEALRRNVVLPYRNAQEDAGSISYMIPKLLISQGKVRHIGVADVTKDNLRRKLEKEEGMYQRKSDNGRV